MTAEILQFVPRSNKRRALIIPIEIAASEVLKDEAFQFEDTVPAEYVSPDKDNA